MPKLKVSDADKVDIAVRQAIARYTTEMKDPHVRLPKAMRISKTTYYERLKKPGNITLGELRGLCRTLPVTDEEIIRMVKP